MPSTYQCLKRLKLICYCLDLEKAKVEVETDRYTGEMEMATSMERLQERRLQLYSDCLETDRTRLELKEGEIRAGIENVIKISSCLQQ